ncbi:MAG: hypothetical protein N4J56_001753 [Chroococcidiopsis sp. SAG 2025]|uniref:hypothetical protein n=1 Tax=Chroococcidiopsis sp. SAG 2025 TaxID=171389 RepID=UPI00293720E4|nr:hypothetical protein [Chroococcidiopsis sp. SAG 2025]MDV2992099.1 hypothetical protein [Chroococcidiopsis sp. SAG 2025]
MPFKFAKLSALKKPKSNVRNRKTVIALFESKRDIVAHLPNIDAVTQEFANQAYVIDQLIKLALNKNSDLFWRLLTSLDDEETITKVGIILYHYFKDWEPAAYNWYIDQMVENSKGVLNF